MLVSSYGNPLPRSISTRIFQLLPPKQATFSEVFEDKERKCMEMRYLIGCISCVSRFSEGCGPYVKSYHMSNTIVTSVGEFVRSRWFRVVFLCWHLVGVTSLTAGSSRNCWRRSDSDIFREERPAGNLHFNSWVNLSKSTCQLYPNHTIWRSLTQWHGQVNLLNILVVLLGALSLA